MFNKKIFVFIFLLSFIPTIILIFVLDVLFKPDIEDVKKTSDLSLNTPTEMLMSDLSSSNSIMRRQAIETLGVKKASESVSKLFFMMMSNDISENDLELVINSLYSITEGKIIEKAKELLYRYALFLDPSINPNKKKVPISASPLFLEENLKPQSLTSSQLMALLSLLNRNHKINSEDKSFDFINTILLKETSREVVNKAILISGALGIPSTYTSIKNLFSKEFFYKVSVIYSLREIVFIKNENNDDFENFLINILSTETHPTIQQETNKTLYYLYKGKDYFLSRDDMNLINDISLLNSPSLASSLFTEKKLLSMTINSKQSDILNYFSFYKGSSLLKLRILNIIKNKKLSAWLNKENLNKVITSRYNLKTQDADYSVDVINVSLEILGTVTKEEQDLRTIISVIYDKRYSLSAVKGLWNASFSKEGMALLNHNNFYYTILSILRNQWAQSKAGPIIYRMRGIDGLTQLLNEMDMYGKMKIFMSLYDIKINNDDLDVLQDKFQKLYTDEEYLSMLNQLLRQSV